MDSAASAVQSVGFPVVCVIGLALFVRWMLGEWKAERMQLQAEAREERKEWHGTIDRMAEALRGLEGAIRSMVSK